MKKTRWDWEISYSRRSRSITHSLQRKMVSSPLDIIVAPLTQCIEYVLNATPLDEGKPCVITDVDIQVPYYSGPPPRTDVGPSYRRKVRRSGKNHKARMQAAIDMPAYESKQRPLAAASIKSVPASEWNK